MGTEFINPVDAFLAPERFSPLRLKPLMPNFGARIEGTDLTAELPEATLVKLREAFLRFGLLIFDRQDRLSPDDQLRVAGIFGDPDLGSHMVEKVQERVDVITIDANRPPLTNTWHSDNTTLEVPSMGTLIQIQKGPTVGGNTGWACTRKAYQCLSERMKVYLDGLVAVHYWDAGRSTESSYLHAYDLETYFDKVRNYPPVEHPVVLAHPLTGEKAIYVNETYTRSVKGLHKYEAKALLDFLYNWIRIPEFYVAHQWQENEIAVWDNYAMQHYALADYESDRVNQRVTFGIHQDADYGI